MSCDDAVEGCLLLVFDAHGENDAKRSLLLLL
jgi:hypothetical protein